jgi:predicted Zn-dependent protease
MTEIEALLQRVFAEAAEASGSGVRADACWRRVTYAGAARGRSRERALLGVSMREALCLRLHREDGATVEVALEPTDPVAAGQQAREAAALLAAQRRTRATVAAFPDAAPVHHEPAVFVDLRDHAPEQALNGALDDIEALLSDVSTGVGERPTVDASVHAALTERVVADGSGVRRSEVHPDWYLSACFYAGGGRYQVGLAGVGGLIGPGGLLGGGDALLPRHRARLQQALERAIRLAGAQPVESALTDRLSHIVFDPSALGWVRAAVAPAFRADIAACGASPWLSPDGAPADLRAAPSVRLVDGPTPRELLGGATHSGAASGLPMMDDDGVAIRAVELIAAGVPQSPLHTRGTGRTRDALAGRSFWTDGPGRVPGATQTFLLPSGPEAVAEDLDAFLGGVERGLWIYGSTDAEAPRGQGGAPGETAGFFGARLILDGQLTDTWFGGGVVSGASGALLGAVERFQGPLEGPFPVPGRRTCGYGGAAVRVRVDGLSVVGA